MVSNGRDERVAGEKRAAPRSCAQRAPGVSTIDGVGGLRQRRRALGFRQKMGQIRSGMVRFGRNHSIHVEASATGKEPGTSPISRPRLGSGSVRGTGKAEPFFWSFSPIPGTREATSRSVMLLRDMRNYEQPLPWRPRRRAVQEAPLVSRQAPLCKPLTHHGSAH
ncbi:hypothetical protein GQ53DRAFT_360820 [Thozetella sp. PMI_491]|nr:hypothetical protein GQ53DRAFT_360820 [Thozetella sp. PMI_491]